MKILEPVPISEIPAPNRSRPRRSKYDDIYMKVLALNGAALPLEFDSPSSALKFALGCRLLKSAARRLGIVPIQRDSTVFLYKKPEKAFDLRRHLL